MEQQIHRPDSPPARVRPKASTSAILGNTAAALHIEPQWEPYYQSLLELRERLDRQKGDLVRSAAELYSGPRRDPADVGTNTYERDWALGMATSDQNALYEIEEALDRIRSGTYGTCQLTGQPISAERLRAIPWTRFSTEAEADLEATGQSRRARLGYHGSLNGEDPYDEEGHHLTKRPKEEEDEE